MLLRALQERRIRPIGGKKEIPVDFRLVAATNRNLDKMVETEEFRSDLLFRIRGIEIKLPPLRKRIGDIQDISYKKIHQLGKLYGLESKGMSRSFVEILERYTWPGNVRELVNVLEHSLSNAGSDPTLVPIHLPAKYRAALLGLDSMKINVNGDAKYNNESDQLSSSNGIKKWGDYRLTMEKKYLMSLQRVANGDWKVACERSGISKTRLYELLKKHTLSLTSP